MSSFSENQLPGSDFLPPVSAQPPKSLFGGPSSDIDKASSQPERSRPPLFKGHFAQYANLNPVPESDPMDETLDYVESDQDMKMPKRSRSSGGGSNHSSEGSPRRGRTRSRRYEKSPPVYSVEISQPTQSVQSSQPAQSSQPVQSSPPPVSNEAATKAPPEPIRYVVDRGLDLPPGTERPNLYQGASSSWRDHNADDIGVSAAMTTERSRDLAAHLYNAHVIRKRMRDSHRHGTRTSEKAAFAVPRRWTAWPVPAPQVPRLNEFIHHRMDTTGFMHQAPDTRPSADLEETIVAALTKISKDKYRARQWDYEDVKSDLDKIIGDKDDMMAEELELKEYGGPMITTSLRPLVQANEDRATEQLRPLARNVITRVDKLLYGLHCAMKGRKYEEESGAEQTSDDDDDDDRSPQKEKSDSRTRSRGRTLVRRNSTEKQDSPEKRNGSRSVSARVSPGPDTEEEWVPDVSRTRDESRDSNESQDRNRYIKGTLRLRDWSEVMGLASMMDLPSVAVMRASKRCADLFEEDMEFHTLPEGGVQKKRNNDNQWVYTYTESDADEESAPPTPQPNSRSALKQGSSIRAQSKATAKTPNERPSKKTKTKTPAMVPHSVSPSPAPGPAKDTSELTKVREPAGTLGKGRRGKGRGLGKGEHRKNDLLCPLPGCKRHENGFSRTWNLTLHMKRVHPSYMPVDDASDRAEMSGDDMIEVD